VNLGAFLKMITLFSQWGVWVFVLAVIFKKSISIKRGKLEAAITLFVLSWKKILNIFKK